MRLSRNCQVSFCEIAPLKIRGERPARLPSLKLWHKQAKARLACRSLTASRQAGEL